MQLVLLSGGSGKRLWPLSNEARSKQFLKMLKRPDGMMESMVQRVWRQLELSGLSRHACFATSLSQREILHNQLGQQVKVVVEPERRDTFPAIALAATYLYAMEGISLHETIVVMPVDAYVEDHFFTELRQLTTMLEESGAELGLVGVTPTHPSESYGYILTDSDAEPTDADARWQQVSRFAEKPSEELAQAMISRGALWNCGVFAFKLNLLIDMLIELGIPIGFEELYKQYARLPKISFDYQVTEKLKHVAVQRHSGSWKDLGTWDSLASELPAQVIGKGKAIQAANTHLINELSIPVAIIGAPNLIVAASPDGILVCDKQHSARLKELLPQAETRPMFEERRWGYYKVLDYMKNVQGNEVLTKRVGLLPGRNLSYQYHRNRNEVWTIISGEGELVLNGVCRKVGAGDIVQIEREVCHAIRAITALEMIEVQSGPELIEEDIYRIAHVWSDILKSIKI